MTPAYLRDKVLWDALLNQVTRLAAAVRNGDKDLADELTAGREMLDEIKADKLQEERRKEYERITEELRHYLAE